MRHYVLTRMAFGQHWSLDANRRRLKLMKTHVMRSLQRQTNQDFTWVVVVDINDPLKEERTAIINKRRPGTIILETDTEHFRKDPKRYGYGSYKSKTLAKHAYRVAWHDAVDIGNGDVLTTRIDDDDMFTVDAMERVRGYAEQHGCPPSPEVLLFPMGVHHGIDRIPRLYRHETNAWQTLYTPDGHNMVVYDYGHNRIKDTNIMPYHFIDEEVGWLWFRHQDTISGHTIKEGPEVSQEDMERYFGS